MGPSTYARVAEITSGRAISQQGLTATCKDRVHKEESEAGGGFWSGAWAHRSDEGGIMPSETTREVVTPVERIEVFVSERVPGNSVDREITTTRRLFKRHQGIASDDEPLVSATRFRLTAW
jgi:hypothetical protein